MPTTHNMTETERVSDRVALLNNGEITFIGKAEALKIKAFEYDVIEISLHVTLYFMSFGLWRNWAIYLEPIEGSYSRSLGWFFRCPHRKHYSQNDQAHRCLDVRNSCRTHGSFGLLFSKDFLRSLFHSFLFTSPPRHSPLFFYTHRCK